MRFFLDAFTGDGSHEEPFQPATASGKWSIIDLRADPTKQAGVCLVGAESGAGVVDFGDSLDTILSKPLAKALGGYLGVTLEQGSLRALITDLLLIHGRENGVRWRRLQASRDGRHRIFLGGRVVYDAPVIVATTITDNFDRADSLTLGSSSESWSWTEAQNPDVWEIEGNRALVQTDINGQRGAARAESDLATADHYAEAHIEWGATGARSGGPAVRFDSGAVTFYAAEEFGGQGTGTQRIIKVIAETVTDLATADPDGASSKTIRLEINGSNLDMLIDGVSQLTVTDTSITGNLRTGIAGWARSGPIREVYFNDFEAADLVAGQTVTLGIATETDTVPSITPVKPILQSIGLAVETDTALTISPIKPIIQAIGLAEETDTVPTITPSITADGQVDTSPQINATTRIDGRKILRTSNGTLWVIAQQAVDAIPRLRYSTDDGANWSTSATAFAEAINGKEMGWVFCSDGAIYALYQVTDSSEIRVRKGTLNGAQTDITSWSAAVTVNTATGQGFLDLAAHEEGGSTYVHVVYATTGTLCEYKRAVWGSAFGTATVLTTWSGTTPVRIEFNHTQADITAVKDSAPHVYASWIENAKIMFRKNVYSSGPSWAWNAARTITSDAKNDWGFAMSFDGTDIVMIVESLGTAEALLVLERDAADTTTTPLANTPTRTGTTAARCDLTYNPDRDIEVFHADAGGKVMQRVTYDRSGSAWGSWATIDADADDQEPNVKLGYWSGSKANAVELVFMDETGAPYPILHERFTFITTTLKTIAVTSVFTPAVAVVKFFSLTIAAASTLAASIAKAQITALTIAATSTVVAAITKTLMFLRVIAVASTFTAAVTKTFTLLRVIATTSTFAVASAASILIGLLRGKDIGRFYRLSDEQFILVVGLARTAAIGHRKSEGWETCSGKFAVPGGERHRPMNAVKGIWTANKSANQATLTSLVNTQLNTSGYRQANGSNVA